MIQASLDVYFRGSGIVPQDSLIRCSVQSCAAIWTALDKLCVLQTLLQSHMGPL